VTGPTIHFTNSQANKLREVVREFVKRAGEKDCPGSFVLLLGGISNVLQDEDNIGQTEIDVLVWMLELYFEHFDETDVDPLAEQAYHKLTGYWYEGFDPWYERIERL